MATLTYKAGDLEPSYVATLVNGDGTVPDLSNAVSVTLKGKLTTGSTLITRQGQFLDRQNAWVMFTWQTGDLNTVGVYQIEVEVIWPGNRPQTVPNDTYTTLVIARKAQG